MFDLGRSRFISDGYVNLYIHPAACRRRSQKIPQAVDRLILCVQLDCSYEYGIYYIRYRKSIGAEKMAALEPSVSTR